MMTYKWMRDVQGPKMKPWGIEFPNHYHTPPASGYIPDTYSMEQFLAANALILKCQLHGSFCVVNILIPLTFREFATGQKL
jgi:hypothetical protein